MYLDRIYFKIQCQRDIKREISYTDGELNRVYLFLYKDALTEMLILNINRWTCSDRI